MIVDKIIIINKKFNFKFLKLLMIEFQSQYFKFLKTQVRNRVIPQVFYLNRVIPKVFYLNN